MIALILLRPLSLVCAFLPRGLALRVLDAMTRRAFGTRA